MVATAPLIEQDSPRRNLIAPLLVGVPVLLLVLWGIGGLTETTIPGLPVVPLATLWALPVDLWVRDVATALTVGFALIGGVLAPRPDSRSGRNASFAALVWLAALIVQTVLTVSEVLALPVSESFNPTIIWSLLTQTTLGRVILIQFMLVAIIALLAWVVLGRVTGLIIATMAIVATFLPGFIGHSGINDGHSSATISLGLHVVAASVWIGGLVATVDYVRRSAPNSAVVLRRFSVLALLSVIVLAESGLVNASLRLYGWASLVTSTYGAVILAKVAVLVVLIGYGWRQRRALAAAMESGVDGTRTLVRISSYEIAWMGVALGLSVALSRTAPPAMPLGVEPFTIAAVGLLGLVIPLAVLKLSSDEPWLAPPGFIRDYPEAVAVILVVSMIAASSLAVSGFGNQQILMLVMSAWLVGVGLIFWSVFAQRRSVVALVIVGVGLTFTAWWNERGIDGGLGIATALVVALFLGVLAFSARRPRELVAA
jgi:putative copper resistance protein D